MGAMKGLAGKHILVRTSSVVKQGESGMIMSLLEQESALQVLSTVDVCFSPASYHALMGLWGNRLSLST